MCRLLAYIGHPTLIADVVLWPDRSIIKQSYDARERIQDPSLPFHLGFGNLNGDGFGIGWFSPDDYRKADSAPCMFKSVTPAWNNENLARLSCKIVSPLIFAHVRAAYPGMPVSEQNCHPFQWGRYLWMHNGVVGGFNTIRRALLATLTDAAYNSIQSFHSDSAVSFAMFLSHLPDMVNQHPPDVLLKAMQDTISTISHVQEVYGITATSLMNFAVSDGSTMLVTRFVRPETEQAATLYYAEGASFERMAATHMGRTPSGHQDPATAAINGTSPEPSSAATAGSQSPVANGATEGPRLCNNNNPVGSSILQEASYSVTYGERGAGVVLVASEPITGSTTDWVCVPKNTALIITREKGGYLNIMRSPISASAPDPIQQEVSTCLEAISRSISTKSSAWVAKKHSRSGEGFLREDSPLGRSLSGDPLPAHLEEEHLLTGHPGPVLATAIDEAAQRLYSAGTDGTVRVWDLTTMCCQQVMACHYKPVTQLALVGGKLYTAAGGGIKVWDTKTFEGVDRIRTSFYSGGIRSMLVLPDGTILVGHHTTIKKYLPSSSPEAPGRSPTPIPTSPSRVAIRQPDAETDAASNHVGPVNCLVVCGQYLCSAGGDAMIRVWRASDLKLMRVLRGHRGSVLCLLAVGNLLLSGARDNAIRVWDLDMDMMCRRTLLGHKDDVLSLHAITLRHLGSEFSSSKLMPTGSLTSITSAAGGTFGHSLSPVSPMAGVKGGSHTPPAGKSALIASASADGTVRIWSSSWSCIRILTLATAAAGAGHLPGDYYSSSSGSGGRQHEDHQDNNEVGSAFVGETEEHRHRNSMEMRWGSEAQDRRRSLSGSYIPRGTCGIWGRSFRGGKAAADGEDSATAGPEAAAAALTVAMSRRFVAAGFTDGGVRLWHADDLVVTDIAQQLSGFLDEGLLQRQMSSGLILPFSPPLSPKGQWSVESTGLGASWGSGGLSGSGFGGVSGGFQESGFHGPRGNPCARAFWAELMVDGSLPGWTPNAPGPLGGAVLAGSADVLQPGGAAAATGEQQQQQQNGALDSELSSSSTDGGQQQQQDGAFGPELSSSSIDGGQQQQKQQKPRGALNTALALANQQQQEQQEYLVMATRAGSGTLSWLCNASFGTSWCLACGSQDQQLVRSLREFVAIRTVSADKKLRDECLRGAKYLARLLEGLGAEVKMSQCMEGKNPVVLGRLGKNPAYPTVVFYGHYDVQPAEEPDWRTTPFQMCAVDGYLCGRGTSDNKGPILAFVYAVKEMLDCWQSAGAVAPINVAFVFEGEEENGSIGFREAVSANIGWFGDANLVVISNTVWVGENTPCLTYGMRGMITASIMVSGPERDIHSGNDGGVFVEPMVDLAKVLASLTEPGSSRIAVPGFYNDVRPHLIDLAWRGLDGSEEFSMEMYRDAIGVPALSAPPSKHDLLEARWCQPSLSIVDVRTEEPPPQTTPQQQQQNPMPGIAVPGAAAAAGSHNGSPDGAPAAFSSSSSSRHLGVHPSPGHCLHQQHVGRGGERSCYRFGPTRFSVIPRMAVGKVSIRFVPEQDAGVLIDCLKAHVQKEFEKLGSRNKVDVLVHSVGDWWEADPESKLFKMAERAVTREWGMPPLYVREGGTMPVASLIEKLLCAPALMIPMGQSSDNCHLANERLRRVNLVKGKNVVRNLLEELAAASAVAAPQPVADLDST